MEKRERIVTLCLTQEEEKRLRMKMEGAGIRSMSVYIRRMALDEICVRPDLKDGRRCPPCSGNAATI